MTEQNIQEYTYQTYLESYYQHDNNNYQIQKNQATEQIANYTHTLPIYITINPEAQTIHITLQETRITQITLKDMQQLAKYLNVPDLTIYTPTRDLLIIDYNNKTTKI